MRLIFATEYPQKTLPGEAMAVLAELVSDAGGSDLTVEAHFESNQSLFAADAPAFGGTVFGASLLPHAKEFELAAIPRGANRINEAARLAQQYDLL
jgi:TRAP-type transport system periplasmic protein